MPNTYIPLGHSIDGAWPRNEHQPVCTACVHACYPSNRGLTRTTPPWLLSSTGQQGAVMGHVASVRVITVLLYLYLVHSIVQCTREVFHLLIPVRVSCTVLEILYMLAWRLH